MEGAQDKQGLSPKELSVVSYQPSEVGTEVSSLK